MSAKSGAVAGPPRTQQHGGMHRQPPRTIAEKVAPAALGGRKLAAAGLIGSAALASPGVAAWASPSSIALAHLGAVSYTAHDLVGPGAPFVVHRVGPTVAAWPGGSVTREVPPRHPGSRLPGKPAHHLSQQRLRVTQRPAPQSSPVVLTSAVSPMNSQGDAAPTVAPATAPGGSGALEPAWLSGQPQATAGSVQENPGGPDDAQPSWVRNSAGGHHDHRQHKNWWEQPSPPPRSQGTRVASDGRHGAGPTPTPAIVSPSYPATAHPGICVDTALQWAGAGGAAANGHLPHAMAISSRQYCAPGPVPAYPAGAAHQTTGAASWSPGMGTAADRRCPRDRDRHSPRGWRNRWHGHSAHHHSADHHPGVRPERKSDRFDPA